MEPDGGYVIYPGGQMSVVARADGVRYLGAPLADMVMYDHGRPGWHGETHRIDIDFGSSATAIFMML